MPRQARLDVPGLLYHIISRGIERREIFIDKYDYDDFISRLERAKEKAPTQILAWALMPNHFHLLLRAGRLGVASFMRSLMTGYATAFNRRHRRAGHLFQNRYKSIVCDEDAYGKELVRYIHLNPLRAKMVRTLGELKLFPWCGHGVLMGTWKAPWQETEEVLGWFSDTVGEARRRYEHFVEEGVAQGRRADLVGGGLRRSLGNCPIPLKGLREMYDERILGLGAFVESVLKSAEEKDAARHVVLRAGITLEQAAERIAKVFGVPTDSLKRRGRPAAVSNAKAVWIYAGVELFGKTGHEMARRTQMSDVAAGKARLRGERLYFENHFNRVFEQVN